MVPYFAHGNEELGRDRIRGFRGAGYVSVDSRFEIQMMMIQSNPSVRPFVIPELLNLGEYLSKSS